MNDQRKAIFEQRREIMQSDDVSDVVQDMRHQVIDDLVEKHVPPKSYVDQWDGPGLESEVGQTLGLENPVAKWCQEEGVDDEVLRERLYESGDRFMAHKATQFGPENMRRVEKQLLLQTVDSKWREHLITLEHLRSVIGFRGYAQRDPLNEYKTEAFELFRTLLESLRIDVTRQLANVRILTPEEREAIVTRMQQAKIAQQMQQALKKHRATVNASPAPDGERQPAHAKRRPVSRAALRRKSLRRAASGQVGPGSMASMPGFNEDDRSTWGNPGRNKRCPCGSGKKFKHCHGRLR